MTEQDIKLIKSSWVHLRRVKPEVVADAFYTKLFVEHPRLRKLFPTDMQEQYEKLMAMLNIIVARLDKFDEFKTDVAAMAIRHKGYGVKSGHYKMVGEALLWTLETGLGNDWNEATEKAWRKCYKILSDTMINATKGDL